MDASPFVGVSKLTFVLPTVLMPQGNCDLCETPVGSGISVGTTGAETAALRTPDGGIPVSSPGFKAPGTALEESRAFARTSPFQCPIAQALWYSITEQEKKQVAKSKKIEIFIWNYLESARSDGGKKRLSASSMILRRLPAGKRNSRYKINKAFPVRHVGNAVLRSAESQSSTDQSKAVVHHIVIRVPIGDPGAAGAALV